MLSLHRRSLARVAAVLCVAGCTRPSVETGAAVRAARTGDVDPGSASVVAVIADGIPIGQWLATDRLAGKFDIQHVSAAALGSLKPRALIVASPHTLPARDLALVIDAIRGGTPALLLVDPLPLAQLDAIDRSTSAQRGVDRLLHPLGLSMRIDVTVAQSFDRSISGDRTALSAPYLLSRDAILDPDDVEGYQDLRRSFEAKSPGEVSTPFWGRTDNDVIMTFPGSLRTRTGDRFVLPADGTDAVRPLLFAVPRANLLDVQELLTWGKPHRSTDLSELPRSTLRSCCPPSNAPPPLSASAFEVTAAEVQDPHVVVVTDLDWIADPSVTLARTGRKRGWSAVMNEMVLEKLLTRLVDPPPFHPAAPL